MIFYQKEYQKKRKENQVYLPCGCGCNYNYNHKHQHFKSKVHQRFIEMSEMKNKISSFLKSL